MTRFRRTEESSAGCWQLYCESVAGGGSATAAERPKWFRNIRRRITIRVCRLSH